MSKWRIFRASGPSHEQRNWSITDPVPDPQLVTMLGGVPAAGVTVNEQTALGIPAVKAAVSLIAGSVASLPLHTISETDTINRRVASVLDDPGRAAGLTSFEWKETVLSHLLLHGNAFLLHIRNNAGVLAGLQPVHPSVVTVERKAGRKLYKIRMEDKTVREFTDYRGDGLWDNTLTHIPALAMDGIRGLSPLQSARNMFGAAIAAERSATDMFARGALITSVAQFDDTVPIAEAEALMKDLEKTITGPESAGKVAYLNRNVKITPVSLTNEDAQWIQSRSFQIEEISRWFQIPPHLLAQTEKQTSYGTGVAEQNLGLARFNLEPWTTRIQERLSWLLPRGQKAEFFYTAFVEPDPATEIRLLIEQVDAGLLTVNEARAIRNLPPLPEKHAAPTETEEPKDDA